MDQMESNEKTGENPTMNTDLDQIYKKLSQAHQHYMDYGQAQVDHIVLSVAAVANENRIKLAQAAVNETKMGVVEDKVIKNHFASDYVFNKYKDMKTCGVIEENSAQGIKKIADSMGIIAAIIPCTNPTSTVIFKTLIALKTRNVVLFCPHPRAKKCVLETVTLLHDAAVTAGAPEGILQCIQEPSVELTHDVMKHPQTQLILATGGPGMVHAAYSSGTPSIGVGAGNTPTIIDETADLPLAVSSIVLSKTFDNGVVCASEQSIIVVQTCHKALQTEFIRQGGYFLTDSERSKVVDFMMDDEGKLNAEIVGQSAIDIATGAGVSVPSETKLLVGKIKNIGKKDPFSWEKLSPVLGILVVEDFDKAIAEAQALLDFSGKGHTAILYTHSRNQDRIKQFGLALPATRVLINIPGSQGAIGDVYNFHLEPSLTLGCGSYGHNSVSGNITPKHLLNFKTVVERRENMLWFCVPPKIYFKYGCIAEALHSLKEQKIHRIFIITDRGIVDAGYVDTLCRVLDNLEIHYEIFSHVSPDPTLGIVKEGLKSLTKFAPDAIIALGGGSPIDAAKIMWLMHDNPEIDFHALVMRFMDIRKRVFHIPESRQRTLFIAIPTTSGTGSEISPFSVITDDETQVKYPIADYALTPDIAILDSQFILSMPQKLCAASGFDAMTHAIEAIVSVMASPFSNAPAKEALILLHKYLVRSYQHGREDHEARSKVHYAAALAGMSFSNASLGIAHSIAHKLGEFFHIPHGVACSLALPHVIAYNATDNPTKLVAFPQYTTPEAIERYAAIADVLGLSGTSAQDKVDALIDYLAQLKATLDLPDSLKSCGIDRKVFLSKLDAIAEQAFDDQCTASNPRYPLIQEIRIIAENIYDGVIIR